jgi:type II secretory ATPase GspE/PulE/Tfp pilus assembly ATPase PilB-like protein
MITSPSGLILISGPTGSGKTATLYASLLRLNDGKRKINTIEDPVEYAIAGLRQSQVNPAINLGFAELLRGILRQSPDVIMIGEIRDAETAQTAVHAANSGQLVFATIHAPSAAHAVQSMQHLGANMHILSTALKGVLSQRLVRTLDPESRTSFDLSDAPHTFDDVRHLLGPDEGKVLYAHVPTEKNHMSGYSGRTGVFEVMPSNKALRALIADGSSVETIRNQARADGMLPFRHAALLQVARGVTSTEELFRVIPTEQLLVDF